MLKQVLAWADAHHERTGRWPTRRAGSVRQAPGENWAALDAALKRGHRGLAAGLSLAGRLARDRQVRNSVSKPRLKIKQILAWADAHHSRTGKWPVTHSGSIHEAPAENWCALSQALDKGARGLPAGASLAKLLAKYGRRRNQRALRPLTVKQVLAWADAHHKRTGQWPTKQTGAVRGVRDETWQGIDFALSRGYRGFPGGRSLVRLLADRRGARHLLRQPSLTVSRILNWADAHHRRTGDWPTQTSGPVLGRNGYANGERWGAIEDALSKGRRGLAGRTTLVKLLAQHRNRRHRLALPRLTLKQVLTWADAHRKRTGRWPTMEMAAIHGAPGETWSAVDSALKSGARWHGPRTSLAKLLAQYRNKPHPDALPRLTIKQVMAWADEHHRRMGHWPTRHSGPIARSGGETWSKINSALVEGLRGFAERWSLAQLLEKRRAVRNIQHLPRLTIKQVLKWIDAHHKRTGRWPKPRSGAIPDSNGETWNGIQAALFFGLRSFRGGFTLAKFLDKHRGVRNTGDLPALRIHQILRWADGHHKRTGKWPKDRGGRVSEARREKWSAIDSALVDGLRGLREGSSLPRLLSKHRGVRNIHDLPRLPTKQILKWADAFHKREKAWPRRDSGRILRSGGETWETINYALKKGNRGLSGGWSLFRFLNRYRRPEHGL